MRETAGSEAATRDRKGRKQTMPQYAQHSLKRVPHTPIKLKPHEDPFGDDPFVGQPHAHSMTIVDRMKSSSVLMAIECTFLLLVFYFLLGEVAMGFYLLGENLPTGRQKHGG